MTYTVVLSRRAERDVRGLDRAARDRIGKVFVLLADTPRPSGARPLTGRPGRWRVRTGDYRVIYEIEDDVLRVLVVRVGHRREVYER